MQREVKLIFFAVGSIGNSSDLVLAKDLENIEEKKRSILSLVMLQDKYR